MPHPTQPQATPDLPPAVRPAPLATADTPLGALADGGRVAHGGRTYHVGRALARRTVVGRGRPAEARGR